jgi:tetratricopeptide (TPR) repeat protein
LGADSQELLSFLVKLNRRKGNLRAAADYLKEVAERYPPSVDARGTRAELLMALGDFDSAIAETRLAIALSAGGQPDLYILLASLLYKRGQYAESLTTVDKARELAPRQLLSLFNMASLYEHLGQEQVALSIFSEAAKLSPGSVPIGQAIARLSSRLGEKPSPQGQANVKPNIR